MCVCVHILKTNDFLLDFISLSLFCCLSLHDWRMLSLPLKSDLSLLTFFKFLFLCLGNYWGSGRIGNMSWESVAGSCANQPWQMVFLENDCPQVSHPLNRWIFSFPLYLPPAPRLKADAFKTKTRVAQGQYCGRMELAPGSLGTEPQYCGEAREVPSWVFWGAAVSAPTSLAWASRWFLRLAVESFTIFWVFPTKASDLVQQRQAVYHCVPSKFQTHKIWKFNKN